MLPHPKRPMPLRQLTLTPVISIDDGVKNEAAASKKNNAAVPMDTAHSADAKERAISIASTPEAVTMRTRMP